MMNNDIAELLVKRCDTETAAGIYTSGVGAREGAEGGGASSVHADDMEPRATAEGHELGAPRGDGASSAGVSVPDVSVR
jgi:hypothetical protein